MIRPAYGYFRTKERNAANSVFSALRRFFLFWRISSPTITPVTALMRLMSAPAAARRPQITSSKPSSLILINTVRGPNVFFFHSANPARPVEQLRFVD
jgi:hypothetical protein